MGNYFLGIDFGTSGARACVIDSRAEILTLQTAPLETRSEGAVRSQAPEDWIHALMYCLEQVSGVVALDSIQSIAVAGTSGSVLLSDDHGHPLTHALMYHDAGSVDEFQAITGQLAPGPANSLTASLPKIIRLANDIGRGGLIQHQADWISGWLSNHYGMSDENNALKTGYDAVNRAWPDEITAIIPAQLRLPDVTIPGTTIGKVNTTLGALGFSPDACVVSGTTDSTASFLASGIRDMHTGLTTLGSTLVVKQLSDKPVTDTSSGVYSHRLGDLWLSGGASNSGGSVLDRYFAPARLQELSEQIDANTDSGLAYYPLPAAGERFPHPDPLMQPVLHPRPEEDCDFLKGIFEGIARIEKQAYHRLHELGCYPITQVVTSGGGAANTVWQDIRQRILGVPVSAASHGEAAYGAALLARHGTDLWQQFRNHS